MFTKTMRHDLQGKKNLRTRGGLAVLALAGALGTAALATPVAASASTITLGPGGISMNADLMQYPAGGGVYASGAMAGCKVLVGDHWRADGQASGEGEVSCSTAHNYSMQVLLEYSTPSGMRVANSASSSWRGAAGTWWYLPTGGVCQPGGTAEYAWTTYVEISIDGSAYQGWFASRQNALYTLPAC